MASETRRHLPLVAIPIVVLGAAFAVGPIAQPPEYHLFADRRGFLGVPNLADVASNLVFLVVGGFGLTYCLRHRPPGAWLSWAVFFAGVTLVSIGSAYYHWAPDDETLVWDRLPMTIGFMGLYVALIAEYEGRHLQRFLLFPAVLLGLASVVYWAVAGDLRFYLAVQTVVLGSAVVLLLFYRGGLGPKSYFAAAVASYAAAVLCEWLDHEVFGLTLGVISGHTAKHLLAGLAIFWILRMLQARNLTGSLPHAT